MWPYRWQPTSLPRPWDSPGKNTGVGCHSVLVNFFFIVVVSVQLVSHVWLFETPWAASRQAPLSFTISWSFLKLVSFESVMLSNHIILCHLLLPPSIFPSIMVFSNDLALHVEWSNYWSFSFNINPSNEYSGLSSFRINWFNLLAVQGTLKSLLQHNSLKSSILQCSAFFVVQLGICIWRLRTSEFPEAPGPAERGRSPCQDIRDPLKSIQKTQIMQVLYLFFF